MPPHLDEKEEIENAFPDDSQYGNSWFGRAYRWYQKKTKTWFAFSYRCTEWWARWRKMPIILIALRGSGLWRWEGENSDGVFEAKKFLFGSLKSGGVPFYLSRVQYYARWHFSIQWPLMITFHFYPKAKDVPKPNEPRPELDGKLWFAYWNHFDADFVYWMFTSFFVGRTFK